MTDFNLNTLHLPPWGVISLSALSTLIVLMAIKRFILGQIKRWTQKTQYTLDTVLIDALRIPLTLCVLAVTVVMIQTLLHAYAIDRPNWVNALKLCAQLLFATAIIAFADQFSSGAVTGYTNRSEALKNSGGILRGILRGMILCIGILVILGTLGISVTPIVASLGISSLAVALALQPTLENFFSGVQIILDKPFRVGDYIELDSSEQGFVEKIGWRSTWIKMLPNNTVIVPNSLISKSKLINYYYPQKELSVPVEVGVHYDSDLEHVERVTLEVAREILKSHKWGIDDYDTFVVFHTFDSSSINFTVMLRAQEYFNRFFIKSAFIKALHQRFNQEGIVIPYPIRAINYDQERTSTVNPVVD